jgi:hypothetical protein
MVVSMPRISAAEQTRGEKRPRRLDVVFSFSVVATERLTLDTVAVSELGRPGTLLAFLKMDFHLRMLMGQQQTAAERMPCQ